MIKTIITIAGDVDEKKRGFNGAVKRTMVAAVKLWHSDMLPHHFATPSAAEARYPGIYKKRTAAYMRTKASKYGHQRLLEYSGATRTAVTAQITVNRVRGRMPGTNRALNSRGRTNMPDMRAELLITNPSELATLAAGVKEETANFLNSKTPVTWVET